MDIDVRNLALLVHTFSRRFELSFSVWSFLQLKLNGGVTARAEACVAGSAVR